MTSRLHAIDAAPYPWCDRVLPGYQFADAFELPAPPGMDAIEATRLAFGRYPWWIRALLGLRNRLCRLAGLKPAPPRGFPVIRQSSDEVVMGFDDRHLDFRILVHVIAGIARVTTIVRWHNAWGRTYLRAVMPFHRVIAARMLEGIRA